MKSGESPHGSNCTQLIAGGNMVRRAETSGAPVVMVTVDQTQGRNLELEKRYSFMDARDCTICHTGKRHSTIQRKPMFDDSGITLADEVSAPTLTWKFLDRLKDHTSMKVVVKGIVRGDDAERCIEHGADGIVVSNHGGRASASGWGTLESLPEVISAVQGKIPAMMDSGIRRGTDVYKALALGARAVMIGRPYLWGLSAFGQPGLEKVLELLQAELLLAMRQMGTPTLSQVDSRHIGLR